MGSVTLALLTNESRALKYRPHTNGATPWYKTSSVGELEDPEYPYNYVVPNFGVDHDVERTQNHLEQAEKSVGTKMAASFKQPKGHPVDYKVPNFGVDRDIVISQGNLAQSEKNLKTTWTPPTKAQVKAAQYEKDYFVPNFGVDRDIATTQAHLSAAEKDQNHTWTPPTKAQLKEADYPKDYVVPNFGVDEDVKMTQAHVSEQEKKQGHVWKPVQDENGVWIVPEAKKNNFFTGKDYIQTEAEVVSDPTCSSAGCNYASEKGKKMHPMNYFVPNFGRDGDINTSFDSLNWAEERNGHKWNIDWAAVNAKKHEKDYFVPNFGVDEDVKMTQAHVAEQEKKQGHVWKPVQDENGVWIVPEAHKNNFFAGTNYLQTEAELNSDPNCSSAGCNYASEKGKKTHPMNYYVPNFGRDHDINTTWSSLDWAEGVEGHKFDPMSKKDAAKLEHEKDYPVPDFGLDEDVVITQKHIAEEEKLKKHEWKPKQDENGVWIVPTANAWNMLQIGSEVNVEHKHKHHHKHSQSSDPICSSAGFPCEQNKKKAQHEIDYKVPNFGVDHDIVQTQKHIAEQEKIQNHKWEPKKDENGVYNVPTTFQRLAQEGSDPVCHSAGCPKHKWFGKKEEDEVLYPDLVKKYGYDEDIVDSVGNEMMVSKAMGLPFNVPRYPPRSPSLIQTESDPVCHSAGCTQYNWMDALKKKGEDPVLYPTGQSLEGDIISTWDNLDVAEKIKNHEWKFNHEVYDNRDKKEVIEYNYQPTLDEDIVNTQDHLASSEKKLGDWDIFAKKATKK